MKDKPLILSLDQGTSSSRAVIFNCSGEIIASASSPLEINFPSDGWVEQDANNIWNSQLKAMELLEKKITPEQRGSVISCGITNQRETTILWRRSSSKPCAPALVWQDRRTAGICQAWQKEGLEEQWCKSTGLVLDPYFSASKISWLLQNEEEAKTALFEDDLCFGTVESWMLWQLSGGKQHLSDMSNASRTLLLDIELLEWMEPYCEVIGLNKNSLPNLVPCQGDFGRIESHFPFGGVPIQALLGDQQAATLGQLCLDKGSSKCTYGTGAFLVVNTGQEIHRSKCGLLSTVGWTDKKGNPTYCLEGSLFNAGTVVQWLRDNLQIIKSADQINTLANEVENAAGVMFVPAFTGWGSPHWDPKARGIVLGITRDTQRGHLARAALEGIALSVATLVKAAEKSLGQELKEIAVDGGAAASNPLLEAQANSTGLPVRRPINLESTARGAALLAGFHCGGIDNIEDLIKERHKDSEVFMPNINEVEREKWLSKWNEAVQRSLGWHE
ncbi:MULTISPECIES: glycerol kinase GlpK [unclassified Prochlorococcus]|uniref:glycerol kinase GlpK n=1 Tax=unclassified Prochlorococcus TaxID=2627481 RepID=UPI00097CD1FD|nr:MULTISPECIES: glycerol kinase GlpK [unclassified Prochlorococcus]AQL31319.1 glycerol kinase [Prochlorococcus sp. RS50]AQL31740.1 glycerol kinase [Prochlorococcus sp. RS01]AQL34692.1 glycerol kinase [Prochlorococcus sp. RS04]